ncbi:Uncharacterized protein TCM_042993 [Theobroma cacao]|uniref:Uncharacterized protein n=1 Tax=Theobroma cacao TaxID=3641 RepID=A0A061FNC0_THECC|nr:Uncharacterized protein TCM_042993 [Theobroma cacao]
MVNPTRRRLAVLKRFPDIEIRICLIFRTAPSFSRGLQCFQHEGTEASGMKVFQPQNLFQKVFIFLASNRVVAVAEFSCFCWCWWDTRQRCPSGRPRRGSTCQYLNQSEHPPILIFWVVVGHSD